jgi:hypothetical protein
MPALESDRHISRAIIARTALFARCGNRAAGIARALADIRKALVFLVP